MKKILFTMTALLASAGMAVGQNALTVGDITLPQNSDAALTVSYQFDAEDTYTGYSFNLELPAELEFVMDEGTDVAFSKGACHDESHSVVANLDEGLVKVAVFSGKSKPLTGTSGTLLTFTIKPKSDVSVGQTFTGTIKDILIVPVEGSKQTLDNSTFTITIGEPIDLRTLLDENSTTAPVAATNVNVRVKRTINANEWSTLVLPFAMTEAQVKAAFGDDVQLGDFTGYDTTEEGEEITGIEMKFDNSITAIEANHPYIIKVSTPITEFTVDGVTIDPDDEPCVEKDNGKTGRNRVVISGFYGTYTAGVSLAKMSEDDFILFLSGNKLWYATSTTQSMKAFRGYFWLMDVLSEVESSASRIVMSFGGDNMTDITNICGEADGLYYNLQGLPVEAPARGMYIRNGKVVIVKQ